MQKTKTREKDYSPESFNNDDTTKQLLVRSGYLIYKAPSNWTTTQAQRAQIQFKAYPDKCYGQLNSFKL